MLSTDARTHHRSVTLTLTLTITITLTVDTNISKHKYDRLCEREYKHTIQRIVDRVAVNEICSFSKTSAMPSIPALISPYSIALHCIALHCIALHCIALLSLYAQIYRMFRSLFSSTNYCLDVVSGTLCPNGQCNGTSVSVPVIIN